MHRISSIPLINKDKVKPNNIVKKTGGIITTFFLLPLLLIFITELLHRQNILSVFKWFLWHSKELLASYLLFAGILSIVLALLNHKRMAFFFILGGTSIIAVISNIKFRFRGEPLLPWDFVLGKEATNISSNFLQVLNLEFFLFLLAVVVFSIILFCKWPQKLETRALKPLERIVLCLVAVVLISSLYTNKPLPIKSTLSLQCVAWDQGMNCDMNGLFLALLMNTQWLSVAQPSDYSAEKISEIMARIDPPTLGNQQVQPNIIMIMSEAFWDPTVMPGASFNRDPIPFFHDLQQKNHSGWLLAPVFAGATANTEFEVLTGHSTQFLPAGALAYAQYVRKPVDSLASILAGQGYSSIAIHSYHNWFYRRNEVYRNLGFGKFVSGEFFSEPERKRYYISDQEVSKQIIKETQNSEKPVFIFTVTMQNHGPYSAEKDELSDREIKTRIQVEGEFTPQGKKMLENYAQNLADADAALEMLVNYFQANDEPTIIVFFGDHLPYLGEDHQVYREAGFYQKNYDYQQYQRMFRVPYVIWSNYLTEGDRRDLNATYLGSYVLNLAGCEGSAYTDYLLALSAEIPFIPRDYYYGEAGIEKSLVEDYQQLQYDLLLGNRYLDQNNGSSIIDPEYFLGSGKITIDSLRFLPEQEEGTIEVIGKNFLPSCQVFFNGKAQTTTFADSGHLTVKVPEKLLAKLAACEMQIKLFDSFNNNIAESNCVLLNKMLK